ncbi:hypothetical protein A0257_04355 [Hymenobacter psoromatis]|nr:hypothetical protein A0257_04355 [Hymenobacter psoromatis]
MKTLPALTSSFALSALLLTAQAQTPAKPHHNPTPAKPSQTADHRAATYQGPKVVKDSKGLGQKMVQKSKPTDMLMRVPTRPIKK